MNGRGRAQAQEVASRVRRLAPDLDGLDFVASPLSRTRDTMEIMRGALGLLPASYRIDPRFVELTFGSWEGLTWREVRTRDAAAAVARERDKWGFVPPGGESYAMLCDRIRPALADLTRPVVVVSHGGVARALVHLLAGIDQVAAPRLDIWQGRVLVFDDGRHSWA